MRVRLWLGITVALLGIVEYPNCTFALGRSIVPAKTSTGFYYPTGISNLGPYAGWLASGCDGKTEYFTGEYHLGKDIQAIKGDVVFAVADGIVVRRSPNGWGVGNVGIIIRHKLQDGFCK